MSRISIQQFHAALADAANQSRPLRVYREIMRRPAGNPRVSTWDVWSADAAVGWVQWPDPAGARA
jgi:hypothetical protein